MQLILINSLVCTYRWTIQQRYFTKWEQSLTNRISHRKCFRKKVVVKNFAIFALKNLQWSLFLIKLQAFHTCNFVKKSLQHKCFPLNITIFKSSLPEVFLGKGVLILCSKFTRENPCRRAISIKIQSNFIEITLRHGCSPVNLVHIFSIPFLKNTSGRLLQVVFLHHIWRTSANGCIWTKLK